MSTARTLRRGVLGRKLGMTQIFTKDGYAIPITVVKAAPCLVVGQRTADKDGYVAVQLGFGEARKIGQQNIADVSRPRAGWFQKRNVWPQRFVREVRLVDADVASYEQGQPVDLTKIFKKGDFVDVTGTSKGKGYQGVMKRHRMPGFRSTHGTHEFFRHGGSIGCRLTPGRVHKGKRMSGHMGDERVTVQSLELFDVLPEENVILIRGAVPGGKNGYLLISNAVKKVTYQKKKRESLEEKSKNPMKASKAGA